MAGGRYLSDERYLAMDEQAVQETEAAVENRAKGGVATKIGNVAGEMAVYAQQDKKSEAEAAIEKQGVEGLQNAFDSLGIKIKATSFRNNLKDGWNVYLKKSDQIQANNRKSAKAQNDSQFYKAIGEHKGFNLVDEYDTVTEKDVNGNEVTRLVNTGKKSSEMSPDEIMRDIASKGLSLPSGFKPELFFGVQEEGSGSDNLYGKSLEELKIIEKAESIQGNRDEKAEKLETSELIASGNMPKDASTHSKLISSLEAKQKEYDASIVKARPVLEITKDLAKGDSKTGVMDIALIFKFMNALDPQSVVREGEFDLAAKAGGYVDGIGALLDKVFVGQLLPEEGMKEMVRFMGAVHNGKVADANAAKARYSNLINQGYYHNQGEDKAKALINSTIKTPTKINVKGALAGIDKQGRFNSQEAKEAAIAKYEELKAAWGELAPWYTPPKKIKKPGASGLDLDSLINN